MYEKGAKVCSVSCILLGSEDHNLSSQISKRRKSFYPIFPPFFPHILCLYSRFVSLSYPVR